MQRKSRIFVGDFETTVYKGQKFTEVWASGSVELFTDEVQIFNSIDKQIEYFINLKDNLIVYYHNLKFDGSFIISHFLNERNYKQAYTWEINKPSTVKWIEDKYMQNKTFKYTISKMGLWYTITLKINNKYIEFRDSLKLLPFSVKEIGEAFNTEHKKLDMEYKGFRHANGEIKENEKIYLRNDLLVIKEALEITFKQGHNKMTIGACCLSEFKKCFDKEDYKLIFPNISEIEIDYTSLGATNVDRYIRNSYRGGWCYVVSGKENKIYKNGVTADVNSLYPSVMHSESGNKYPIGKPNFWQGNYIPPDAIADNKYYFVRVKTRFYIKQNMLPFIQIKGSLLYPSNKMLETSDIYNAETNEYNRYYLDSKGNIIDTYVILTLTMTDYELFKEHYELVDFEILDGCYFYSQIGLFDEYIDKYKKIKIESKGPIRTLAKLFLNNLYGKLASSTDSSFKVGYVKDDLSLGFVSIIENEKQAGYIPIGSAITSYARNFTIRAAQKNYYGTNKKGFIYADTDSIHCDILPKDLKGVTVHESNFCCWKIENEWDKAIFTRQKTYIEHILKEDEKEVEKPYYLIKCAGMPARCKELLDISLTSKHVDYSKYNEEEQEFIKVKRNLTDFKRGLKVPSKLMPKRINGGIILLDTTYEMK